MAQPLLDLSLTPVGNAEDGDAGMSRWDLMTTSERLGYLTRLSLIIDED